MGNLRISIICLAVLALTLSLAPLQVLAMRLSPGFARRLPVFWHRSVLRLIGVRVHVSRPITDLHPMMIVSNHISWSDILVLGSVMPLCFIAKDEVKTWPGISLLAQLQRTVFVNRAKRSDAGIQANTIGERLIDGDAMVLFAEGTTGDGNQILPFKSALFGAAQSALETAHMERVAIVPVAIAYTKLHGLPLGRFHQTQASWPGDIELVPHLKNFVAKGAFDVHVAAGEPILFTQEERRKAIASATEDQVRELFSLAMRGRQVIPTSRN